MAPNFRLHKSKKQVILPFWECKYSVHTALLLLQNRWLFWKNTFVDEFLGVNYAHVRLYAQTKIS